MFIESLRMSAQNIAHNRLRSFLTVLGIVIGVLAIIALITLVQGVTAEVVDQFSTLGAGKVMVNAGGTPLKRGLTESDLDNLRAIDNVSGIAPTISFAADVRAGETLTEDAAVEGKSDVFFAQTRDAVARGRALNYLDISGGNRVCLLDKAMQEKLFYGQDPLGGQVLINGTRFTVVGVLGENATSDALSQARGGSDDGKIVIPYTTAKKLSGEKNVTSLEVYMRDTQFGDEVVAALKAELNRAFNYKDDSYTIINLESLLDAMNTMLNLMTMMLAGIASIALLVGGIGIMNMMLVSVTERTTEIGLRKALGATPRSIQLQFLLESIILSLLGGLIGAVLGLAVSFVLSMAFGIPFSPSAGAVMLGVGFSAAVGVAFGWMPARRASRLNPIDALRSA